MENEFIENNHTIDDSEIKVHCWNCGKGFYMGLRGIHYWGRGHQFCSDKCRKEDYEKWLVIKGG